MAISHENFPFFLKNFEFEKWSTLDFDIEEDNHHSMATSSKPTMDLLEKVNKGIPSNAAATFSRREGSHNVLD